MTVPDHVAGRQFLIDKLREELVGPSPAGAEISLEDLEFATVDESYRPYRERGTGEEILAWDRPIARYGVGVLFPAHQAEPPESTSSAVDALTEYRQADAGTNDDVISDAVDKQVDSVTKRGAKPQEDDFDLSAVTARRPSAMGVSFLMELADGDELVIEAAGGRYDTVPVRIAGRAERRRWFVRRPWTAQTRFSASQIRSSDRRMIIARADHQTATGLGTLELELHAYPRVDPDGRVLTTITLVNRSQAGIGVDTACLFQTHLSGSVQRNGVPRPAVLPYPTPPMAQLDVEEKSLALLYQDARAYAVGHGCSAGWELADGDGGATRVNGEVFPVVETPSITPDIRDDAGEISVSMKALADAKDLSVEVSRVVEGYAKWIADRRASLAALSPEMTATAKEHLDRCDQVLTRMRAGIALVSSDTTVARAFSLANEAMLLQQLRSGQQVRSITGNQKGVGGHIYDRPYDPVDRDATREGRGAWRPFQIAFLLMCLVSVANAESDDRELVELIWFPTGGGKTEAYLGLAAFSTFLRRLRDPEDIGVDVLMRYTLRLLTAQQFQRASTLICAMEYLRGRNLPALGQRPFTIGIWLGGQMTPNTGRDAQLKLRQLTRQLDAENPFLVTKCPWCAAQIGPVRSIRSVVGYKERENSVAIRCTDGSCDFKSGLPIRLVDEDLYRDPPSLLIGTVDKFAMLAWRPEARALFGIGSDGKRRQSPPNVIIQDELHLISGPLGTMIGLYEMVIEELCTDRRRGGAKRPKIITSTATARRFREQTQALFARTRAELFPPPGLDIADSYFARFATEPDGTLRRGRSYVGVHASNHNSLITTQVHAMAANLQSVRALPADARDPWWTNMVFFNTLRDLGTSLSLVQSNIPMHLKAIRNRMGIASPEVRYIDRVLELTSRLRNDEVPAVMAQLERPLSGGLHDAVDICLASNIIEVGIDIDRLSLMTVVGQPKSTSQYIQVTGRIGRRWWERPGLVVTLLNPVRPRDRSHYEQFRAYHERLYAQVEPTTVTPFSPPALERGLHAALAAFVRQFGDQDAASAVGRVPDTLFQSFRDLAQRRVRVVEPAEEAYLMSVIDRRLAELGKWKNRPWGGFPNIEGQVLASSDSVFEVLLSGQAWPTPTSMRTVDAECELEITAAYEIAGTGSAVSGPENP